MIQVISNMPVGTIMISGEIGGKPLGEHQRVAGMLAAPGRGLEPLFTGPKPVVLPLNDPGLWLLTVAGR